MAKSKRLAAILLAVVMMISSMSVAASAAHTAYLDSAITDQYNSIDKVELEKAQKASLLLDDLDIMLAKEEIVLDIPLIGTIDLTSTDAALDSIYDLTGNWLYGSLTVGDLVVLENNRGDIASVRRTTTDKTDVDVIESLVTYLANCAPTLVEMIDPDADFSWGIVKGFLPPEFRIIIDDFNAWLDELLWDLLHPVNEEVMPEDPTLDYFVQFLCDNQLGMEADSARAIAMGFEGVMPGFTLDIDGTDANAYRALEEGIYQALNEFVVPLLNNELKDVIVDAVAANQDDGGDLYQIINVNYNIPGYTFDREKGLMEQLNDMFGEVVDLMLIPLTDRPADTTYTFEWDTTLDTDQTYVDLLEANLHGVMSMIIVAGGEANFDPSAKSLEEIGDYIARIAVDEFVKHMTIPENATMEQVAYLGLRELCASVMPENYYALLPSTTTDAGYRAEIIEIAADLGTYYLNNNIGLDCAMSTTSGEFLTAFILWCEDYTNCLFDNTQYNTVKTQIANGETGVDGWDLIDTILWQFIPKDWIPYGEMFNNGAGTAADLTFESLLNYFLDTIFTFDVEKLDTFFAHNTSSPLYTKNVRVFFIDWISDILNGAFTPSGATSCVPTGITSFEAFINPVTNATGTICNILKAIDEDKDLQTTVINLVTMLMGLADPQSLSDVDIDIDSRINCTSGSIPDGTKMRISNYSDGVNSGWLPVGATAIDQDKMYEIELISLTNTAGLTASVTEGYKIAANGYLDVTISGTVAATTEARFDLTYYLLDEDGARINNGTPLVKSVYTHLYTATGNYDVTSAESTANNVTFEDFSTYLYTTDVYTASLFSILATNESGLVTSAVDITKAIVTGTLPTGISANVPTSGAIVSIDDSSATTDSYGTVNPYVSNVDPDAAQPYGIYEVTIQFEVQGKNILGQTTTGTSEARAHKIVVYNDFGLPGLLNDVMSTNRQRIDFATDADAEWTAYQNAVSSGYALIQGNPDHSKMFADVTNPDGSANAYSAAVTAIETAIAALDAKAVTDATKLAALETAVEAYADTDREDYLLYTYDRFKDAYNRANGLVNSQVAPEGDTTFVAPAIPVFDLVYAKEQLELWGGRLITKTVDTRYLEEELEKTESLTEADYATDLWADLEAEITLADSYIDNPASTTQGKVNANRVNLMEAMLALKPKYLQPVGTKTTVVDTKNFLVYGLTTKLTEATLSEWIEAANGYTVDTAPASGSYYGTGSTITVSPASSTTIAATYTIIIYCDLNGDGEITSTDDNILGAHLDGDDVSILVEGSAAFIAADLDRDGAITENDYDLYSTTVNQVNPAA